MPCADGSIRVRGLSSHAVKLMGNMGNGRELSWKVIESGCLHCSCIGCMLIAVNEM